MKKKLCLIDGSGYIFRAFYAFPSMTRSDGTPINAVYGFTSLMMQFMKENKSDYIAIVFDAAKQNFRNEIFPLYKANRKETPPDLAPQFSLIREVAPAFNIAEIEKEGYEADDVIATYARLGVEKGLDVTIVSSDKDLTQLLEPGVEIYDPMKKKKIGEEEVLAKFGVSPDKVIEVQSIQGDSTDNIPGIKGIGPKGAASLINQFGSLENIYTHLEEIEKPRLKTLLTEGKEMAFISKKLVTLDKNVPVPEELEIFKTQDPNPEKIKSFLVKQEFKSLLPNLDSWVEKRHETVCRIAPQQNGTYTALKSEEDLKSWAENHVNASFVAFNTFETETATGIAISASHKEGAYLLFPTENQSSLFNKKDTLSVSAIVSFLNSLFTNPSCLKIGHHIKSDQHLLEKSLKTDFQIMPKDDICLMDYAIYGHTQEHHLQDMSLHLLEYLPETIKEISSRSKEEQGEYFAKRADLIGQMYPILKQKLGTNHFVYEILDKPLIQTLYDMENAGIKVDKEALATLHHHFEKEIETLQQKIFDLAGEEFNINSPLQVGHILYDKLELGKGKKARRGYTTSAAVLEKLEEQGSEIAGLILEYRQKTKLQNTYVNALTELTEKEERIHTTFLQTVTSTGRLSSVAPNMQNIPIRTEEGRLIRRCFKSDTGKVFVDADYSQVELRLIASLAPVPALIKAFKEGHDIHTETASTVFDIPKEQVTPELRRQAKAINFGIIYGISEFGLSKNIGISRKEASSYIATYFEKYPEIKTYMEQTILFAKNHGYVETLFGRKCFIDGILNKNQMARAMAERAAINAPIQGTAADIIKLAMADLSRKIKEKNIHADLLLQIHDELIFEVPENEKEALKSLVRETMENVVTLPVPLKVEVGEGTNWNETH